MPELKQLQVTGAKRFRTELH